MILAINTCAIIPKCILFVILIDYCYCFSAKENLAKFEKEQISETKEAMSTKIDLHAFCINLYLHKIFELILFFDPHGPKEKFGHRKAISPKPERLCPPKLICMHFTTTSTCMNFLSQFYFLTPMDWSFLKAKKSKISKTGWATPTKIDYTW